MTLRLVGAGLPRTGTTSLKAALEQLLGGRCYHMVEVFARPDDVPVWQEAVDGGEPDWEQLFAEYEATVDWPASAFWGQLTMAFPEAFVLLSERSSPETWWHSADRTVLQAFRRPGGGPGSAAWDKMAQGLVTNWLGEHWDDQALAMAAYERHNAQVRATVPADRLIEWQPGDDWGPLCAALDLPIPDEPFPHRNTTKEFREMAGFD